MKPLKKQHGLQRRKARIQAKVKGTAEKPRLNVSVSLLHVSAQIIDDAKGATLASTTTVGQKKLPSNLTERAKWVGKEIASKAKEQKITKVVFDRNGRKYHGRVQAMATAARESGLEF